MKCPGKPSHAPHFTKLIHGSTYYPKYKLLQELRLPRLHDNTVTGVGQRGLCLGKYTGQFELSDVQPFLRLWSDLGIAKYSSVVGAQLSPA
jgi:hypothetical protein